MSRRAYFHFAVSGLFWGIPYLLMKVAVRDLEPAVIVCGRVLIGAAILIPLAIHQKVLMDAIRGWRYVLPYAIFEMMIPWILITNAEKKISSGLAGLLVATVPIWSTIFASLAGDKTVWHSKRLVGIAVGFAGLVGLVGYESIFGETDIISILMMLVAAISYSFAVNMISLKLPDVSGIAINGVAMFTTCARYFLHSFGIYFLLHCDEGNWSSSCLNRNLCEYRSRCGLRCNHSFGTAYFGNHYRIATGNDWFVLS